MNKIVKKNGLYMIASCLFVLVAIIIAFLIFEALQGDYEIDSASLEPKKNTTIACSVDNLPYPYFSYDNTYRQSTEIRIIFEDDNFQAISLVHRMYYDNSSQVNSSYAINMADLNKSFGEKFGAFAFNSKFDTQDSLMQFTMYVDFDDISSNALKYFLTDEEPQSVASTKNYYSEKGFQCIEL